MRVTVVLVLLLCASAIGVFLQFRDGDIGPADLIASATSSPPDVADGVRVPLNDSTTVAPSSVVAPRESPARQALAPSPDPIHDGLDAEQIAWRTRTGFPTSADLDASKVPIRREELIGPVTPSRVHQAQFLGVVSAADRPYVVEYLERAAAGGSLYALDALGNLYAHPRANDPVMADAYYGVGIMLGNWIRVLGPSTYGLSDTQQQEARLTSLAILARLNRLRAASGLPPLQYDPAPGLDDLLGAMRSQPPATQDPPSR